MVIQEPNFSFHFVLSLRGKSGDSTSGYIVDSQIILQLHALVTASS